jgi:predicted O-methyltransferase YrrM
LFLSKQNIHTRIKTKKQINLFSLSNKRVCEIGFNAGHSALLFLLSNQVEEFTIFDNNQHPYTNLCYDYIRTLYNPTFEFVEGDSTITIPKWIEETKKYEYFDVVHVDGGHSLSVITNDFMNALKIVKKNGHIIIDDVQKEHIDRLVDVYISTGALEEVFLLPTTIYPHRILKKLI